MSNKKASEKKVAKKVASKVTGKAAKTIKAAPAPVVKSEKVKLVASADVKMVEGLPRNIQCSILRNKYSIGAIAIALNISPNAIPTQAADGKAAIEKARAIAKLMDELPK